MIRSPSGLLAVTVMIGALASGPALAQPGPAAPARPPADAPVTGPPAPGAPLDQRLKALEEGYQRVLQDLAGTRDGQEALRRELAQRKVAEARLRRDLEAARKREERLASDVDRLKPLWGRFTGYLDFGLFHVTGNGSGIRSDLTHAFTPRQFRRVPGSWTFLGDPLSTAINSRGEPASTADSRAVTFDPIKSNGKTSFILNALNLGINAGVGKNLSVTALIDFLPRGRDVSDPGGLFLGDYLDLKLAFVTYQVPIEVFGLSLQAGKMDSVLGIEYRGNEAPDKIAVTPSLTCRYTCGRPIGLKARATFGPAEAFSFAVAVTNGSHFVEIFPFQNEIDRNFFKTVAGRAAYRFGLGAGLELGVSGAYGAQDLQADESVRQWHAGADFSLDWRDLLLTGEFVRGKAEGKRQAGEPSCGTASCLDYKGAYGQLTYRWLNWLWPYLRFDWRNAVHRSGDSFVYLTDIWRATLGVRLELGAHVIVKAQYTFNRELGPTPEFPDDIFTSSLVVRY